MSDVPQRVSQMADDRRKAGKREEDLEKELSDMIAANLVRDMEVMITTSSESQVWKKMIHRTDDTSAPLAFLNAIANRLSQTVDASAWPYLIVFVSSTSSQRTTSLTTILIAGSDARHVKTLGDTLKVRFGSKIKGGGTKGRWSGKFTGVWRNEGKEGQEIRDGLRDI